MFCSLLASFYFKLSNLVELQKKILPNEPEISSL